jgi:ubiquinone/menaquinone biosynthesis C-methylase UbiE
MATDKQQVRRAFDATARDYHARREGAFSFQTQKKLVLELLGDEGGTVLDIGCGPCVMGRDLLERGFAVWGVDLSETMIEYGRARLQESGLLQQCHLSVGDVEQLAFSNQFFDAVVCMGVFEYLPSHEPAIREIHRVLKRAGRAIISLPRQGSPYELASNAHVAAARLAGRARRAPRRNLCVPDKLEGALRRAGFSTLTARHCTFRFLPDPVLPGLSVKLDQRLERVRTPWLRRWMGAQCIVRAEKAA